MSNFDPKMRGPDFRGAPTRSSGSWIAGAIIVVILIIAVGYVFSNRMTEDGTTEHRASADDMTTPATPVKPLPAPGAAPSTAPAAPAPAATPDGAKP